MDLVCADKNFLKNPQKLPLNKLYLQYDSIHRNVKTTIAVSDMLKRIEKPPDKYGTTYSIKPDKKPAIDKCWINPHRKYVMFQPFYAQFDDQENSQFVEKNTAYLQCLQFFVTCSFQQFWCYIAHEPRCATLLINFLENGVPPNTVKYLNAAYLQLYNEIYNCIFKIYQRLIDFSVSETEFIEEDAAVTFLRKTNLISSHVIMDFCYLFAHNQRDFVEKLVGFCFLSRYKDVYCSELVTLVDDIHHDLDELSMRSKLGVFNPIYIEETASYLVEAVESFFLFTNLCKPLVDIALEHQFPHSLPHIYQKVYTDLYEMYDMKCDLGYDGSKLNELIVRWLSLGREYFIQLLHTFIDHCLTGILKFRNQQQKQQECLEIYLALVSTALDDDLFIRDYNQMHSVEEQFKILIDNIPDFDKSQTEYLLQSLPSIAANTSVLPVVPSITPTESPPSRLFPHDRYKSIFSTLHEAVPGPNQPDYVLSAVKEYKELRKQWELNSNCWLNIDANNEPETSQNFNEQSDNELDFESAVHFSKPTDNEISRSIAAVKEMLPNCSNQYILEQLIQADYRPELVISRFLDAGTSTSLDSKTVVYIGKKPQHNDARDLLNDKSSEIKNLVLKASYSYENDDDYDDRNEIYNIEPDKDNSKMHRHLKHNNREHDVVSDTSSSEDDGEGEASAGSKPRNAFCEDPAIIRARRAAQRGRVFNPSTRNADVVGKPKGQGQDNNVQHNRDKKQVQKSSRANHNRKGGAQWKRSRGMMPS